MAQRGPDKLSRRERQIMEIVFRLGQATAAEVHAELPDPPSRTAVRTLLRILESKGHLKHRQEGPRHIYLPRAPKQQAARTAFRRVLSTFFDGSLAKALAAHLIDDDAELSTEEFQRLLELIQQARQKGT